MHSCCHALLKKDGDQATASAGHVSRHSLPNYLHQFVFETCAFNSRLGAGPGGEIRQTISDS